MTSSQFAVWGCFATSVPGRRIDHFMIRVPDIKVVNPISKMNWDGAGVEPDVKVKATDALATAEKLAERKLQGK